MNAASPGPITEFLHELADEADKILMSYFRAGAEVDNKDEDGFDPVTRADRETESALRALIEKRYPEHGIRGEEFADKPPAGDKQPVWIIDPLDGTRSFITGMVNWMTLIGLADERGAIAGIASQAFTSERFFAVQQDDSSYVRDPNGQTRALKASAVTDLAAAKFCTTVPNYFTGALAAPYGQLLQKVRLSRFSGDAYFFCMLAAGHIDLVIDPGLQSYDVAALVPIVEKAGGTITTLTGAPAHDGGDIIAAATPELHKEALALFS